MGKKSKSAPSATILDLIRSSTSYGAARTFLGAPMIVAGFLLLLASIGNLLTTQIIGGIAAFFAAMFCFSLASLGKALFDLADCALLSEARARARDAREARETYRANEPQY